jgi:hypothetical protein
VVQGRIDAQEAIEQSEARLFGIPADTQQERSPRALRIDRQYTPEKAKN